MEEKIQQFVDYAKERDPDQPEFLQAVHEVAAVVLPFIEDNKVYQDKAILKRMIEPERAVTFRVPWVDDLGKTQVNRGFRVQFNSAIGPYKGGLRFHPSVNLSIMKFLGFEQTFKNALTTLPMGGGKGGSDFNPKGKSDAEVMRFCQSFMTELARHIGADTDVPAGDIGVGGREVGFLFGQYKRIRNEFTGTLTGKGLEWGGSNLRTEATGFGAVMFMSEMLSTQDEKIEGKTVVISGSGNVALHAAQKCIEMGAKVISLSDSGGSIHDPDGISMDKLDWVKELKTVKRGRICEYVDKFSNAEFREKKRPWDLKCDLAFPCATQNELEKEDAKHLVENGCIAVTEGANMPCTPEAVKEFRSAKILFSPGKASNAGGVATSGLEMSQNSLRLQWTSEEVLEKLEKIMKSIHDQCVKYGKDDDGFVDYVRGANIAAFKKVADAMLAQGVV